MADETKRPRGRKKNVTGEGKGLYKRGEGLGSGPVGSEDGYAGKKADQDKGIVEDLIGSALTGGLSGQGGLGSSGSQNSNADLLGSLLGGSQGSSQGSQNSNADLLGSLLGGGQNSGSQSGNIHGSSGSQGSSGADLLGSLLGGSQGSSPQGSQNDNILGSLGGPNSQSSQNSQNSNILGSLGSQNSQSSQQNTQGTIPFGQNASSSGGGKRRRSILPLIIILVLAFFLLRRCSNSAANQSSLSENTYSQNTQQSQTQQSQTQQSQTQQSQTQQSQTQPSQTQQSQNTQQGQASQAAAYAGDTYAGSDILSQLFGSSAGSGGTYTEYGNTSGNMSALSTDVAGGAREKRTQILGGGRDVVTIMVYMCGTDLESQSGMGTSDLMEMTKANLGSNVNLIVFTGGCKRWNNGVVSSSVNQIYKVETGGLSRLSENAGTGVMTDPKTLASFIQTAAKNFPANRYELILWDHGSGSVAGYGYDEKNARSGSMSLSGISKALKAGGVTFDFVGFDACLMATAETALMLDPYADYMVASEETEPGIGWYYTDWLTQLSANTSIPTGELGKTIVDTFVAACNKKCPGQKTTLSLIDLAEFAYTVPEPLSAFARSVSASVAGGQYETISNARYKSREFATSSRIDQIDFIDFCNKIGSSESQALAEALRGAIKYNRTSADMTNAYGVAVYFPYRRTAYVDQAVRTFTEIGISEDFTKCIREAAGMATSGQIAAGGTGSPFESLFGGYGSSSSSSYSSSGSSADLISQLLGGFLGGGDGSLSGYGSSSSYDFFSGRSMSIEDTAAYVADHMLDPEALVFAENENGDQVLTLSEEEWQLIHELDLNLFYDDGTGYLDLGLDNLYEFDEEGNLIADSGDTWLAVNDQIVAYYHLDTVDDGENYKITGRIPVLLNGERADLLVTFDNAHEGGYISGVQKVITENSLSLIGKVQPSSDDMDEGEIGFLNVIDEESDSGELPENMPALQDGDTLEFLCDYYDYDGNYQDSYRIGEPMVIDGPLTISDVTLPEGEVVRSYRVTDIYNREYWTAPY